MNEQEQWDKLGLKLRQVAKDAAMRAGGKETLLTVHVLVDGEGNPVDWFGPNWERITPEQWQAAKDAVANVEPEPPTRLDSLIAQSWQASKGQPVTKGTALVDTTAVSLNTTGQVQLERAVEKALRKQEMKNKSSKAWEIALKQQGFTRGPKPSQFEADLKENEDKK